METLTTVRGERADGVVVMNYDEHYASSGGTAGPVASQDWFTNNLVQAKKVILLDNSSAPSPTMATSGHKPSVAPRTKKP
jgi:hypothetical protein